jgi:hypothetical protein
VQRFSGLHDGCAALIQNHWESALPAPWRPCSGFFLAHREWHCPDNARSNDPSTWACYADAVAAVKAGVADGIGYMLKDSNIGAIDLDHCVDRETAKLIPWAEQLHDEALSTSGDHRVRGRAAHHRHGQRTGNYPMLQKYFNRPSA